MRDEIWSEAFRTSECLRPEAVLEAVTGASGAEEARRFLEHCESCPACSAEHLLAQQFASGESALEGDPFPLEQAPWRTGRLTLDRPGSWARRFPATLLESRFWVSRLAAALLLATGLGGLVALQREGRSPAPPLPEPHAAQVQRGAIVEVVLPRGNVDEAPSILRWHEAEGALRYRARLLEVDDQVAWQAEVDSGQVELPTEVREGLRPGVPYRWQVEATGVDGSVVARSELVGFSIGDSAGAGERR